VESALVTQALLARLDGDAHRAEDLFHEALDLVCRVGLRFNLCDTLDGLGGSVADQGRFEEAARILGAAHGLRETIGCLRFPVHRRSHEADTAVVRDALGAGAFDEAWAEGAALALDDAIAYARRGRGKRKRPTHGWKSLTPTEVRVTELVADGLTNRQIGQKLFISPRTIQTHLSHVFTKLGVSTRAELAANVAKHRPPER
jgi:DNA-binding CsgD family transcriptional regulator